MHYASLRGQPQRRTRIRTADAQQHWQRIHCLDPFGQSATLRFFFFLAICSNRTWRSSQQLTARHGARTRAPVGARGTFLRHPAHIATDNADLVQQLLFLFHPLPDSFNGDSTDSSPRNNLIILFLLLCCPIVVVDVDDHFHVFRLFTSRHVNSSTQQSSAAATPVSTTRWATFLFSDWVHVHQLLIKTV